MSEQDRRYISYLLRLWQVESRGQLGGRRRWRTHRLASGEVLPAWLHCSLSCVR